MKNFTLLLLAFTLLQGCHSGTDVTYDADRNSLVNAQPDAAMQEEQNAPIDEAEPQAKDESAKWATVTAADSGRMFVREANLKFKVKDVAQATYSIEAITRSLGGFIESSTLQNTVSDQTTTKISADSTLETTLYNTSCAITLRIPAYHLDSALTKIADFSVFMDYRKVTTTDIALTIMALKLDNQRYKKYESYVEKKAAKDSSTDELFARAGHADAVKLEKMRVMDKVLYSTVVLDIYQPQGIQQNVIASPTPKPYEPSFGSKVADSLVVGLDILVIIFLALLQLWWIGLIAAIVIPVVLYYKRHCKNKKEEKQQ